MFEVWLFIFRNLIHRELTVCVWCAVDVQFRFFSLLLTHFLSTVLSNSPSYFLLPSPNGIVSSGIAMFMCVGLFLASLFDVPFVCLWADIRLSYFFHLILLEHLDNSVLVVIRVFTVKVFPFFCMFDIFHNKILGKWVSWLIWPFITV